MTVNLTLTVALAIVCHAALARVKAPPQVVEAVCWLIIAVTLVAIAFGVLR